MKKQQQQNNVRINKWMESERVGVMERGGKRMYGEVNEARWVEKKWKLWRRKKREKSPLDDKARLFDFLVHSLWVLVCVCLQKWESVQKDMRQREREGGERGKEGSKKKGGRAPDKHRWHPDRMDFELYFDTNSASAALESDLLLSLTFTWYTWSQQKLGLPAGISSNEQMWSLGVCQCARLLKKLINE